MGDVLGMLGEDPQSPGGSQAKAGAASAVLY